MKRQKLSKAVDGIGASNTNAEPTEFSSAPIVLQQLGEVAVVYLNRPKALNAFSPRLVVMLANVWQDIKETHSIKSVVITGEGKRAFSAGADLKLLVPLLSGHRKPADEWDENILRNPELLDVALLRTFDICRPTIAAINGLAIGGGFELIQNTDLRVISENATLCLQEVKWGLFPAGGSTVNLPRQLPYALAMEMLLLGQEFSAQTAFDRGLVNAILPQGEVFPKACEMANRLASVSSIAVQAIRRSVRETHGRPIPEGLKIESNIAQSVFQSSEAKQGLKNFNSRKSISTKQ